MNSVLSPHSPPNQPLKQSASDTYI